MDENHQRRGRHTFAQPAAASYGVCTAPWPLRRGAGLADPAQAGSAGYRGAKHRAAGMGRKADPLEASVSAQRRRREGVRDWSRMAVTTKAARGEARKARRRIAPTRPGRSICWKETDADAGLK